MSIQDYTLDIGDNDIDSLNRHLVQLEIVWGEPIVRDDDVGILLCWLDKLLEGWLCHLLIGPQESGKLDLLLIWSLGVLQHTP